MALPPAPPAAVAVAAGAACGKRDIVGADRLAERAPGAARQAHASLRAPGEAKSGRGALTGAKLYRMQMHTKLRSRTRAAAAGRRCAFVLGTRVARRISFFALRSRVPAFRSPDFGQRDAAVARPALRRRPWSRWRR
jgi:hypothetical protein